MHTYTIDDGPKMLAETLSVAQSALCQAGAIPNHRANEHSDRLQRLLDECERKRPTGPDCKHGDRHTSECGCIDGQLPKPAYDANGDMVAAEGTRLRRVGWMIHGGPYSGLLVVFITDEIKNSAHGGFTPVYMEVRD